MNKTQDTIVVLGMAASGRAAATLALAQGAHVIGMDLNRDVAPLSGVEMMLGPPCPSSRHVLWPSLCQRSARNSKLRVHPMCLPLAPARATWRQTLRLFLPRKS